jgi:Protein of unknown function (DUF2971)
MDASPQVAGQLGLKSLYHYQDFNLTSSNDHVGRLSDILKNHRIWCSNPATFNDPWDCKPYFDPALLDDPLTRAATAETLISTRKGGVELDHVDEKLRRDPEFLKAAIHRFSVELLDFIASRWGVYCLSPDPCLTLMWSHYARDHKGICLEFAVQRTKFHIALKVQYQKEYPTLLLHDPDSRFTMLLVRSDDWIYEQEFRMICPRFTDVKASPLIMDGNYLKIGPNDLTSIILGCQIQGEAKAKIEALVEKYAPNVRLRHARRAPNKYRLDIED